MEEMHRSHKENTWGWVAALPVLARMARIELKTLIPPADRVTTSWSLRARHDWSA